MIEVQQTILEPPDGDCLRACIASILELPLELVPHYVADHQFQDYRAWLRPMNLDLICLTLGDPETIPEGYVIFSVEIGEAHHSVVAKDREIVWDPHPDGLESHYHVSDLFILQVLDPSRPVLLKAAA